MKLRKVRIIPVTEPNVFIFAIPDGFACLKDRVQDQECSSAGRIRERIVKAEYITQSSTIRKAPLNRMDTVLRNTS